LAGLTHVGIYGFATIMQTQILNLHVINIIKAQNENDEFKSDSVTPSENRFYVPTPEPKLFLFHILSR
jgi:hypothetical protein